ncbi:acyl carrier protein [Methylobacterium oryzihabitans]|uniref:Acyl carrier protein n=1 Tax=Methylobacterium oryzihabitans TaxID=2499852 RepID=A0A3S2XIY9_9HYPH|nr:acyl carrier protein [Methylobacterium oryzihabitans]RVU15956.1 acyl carrier protein [Methylobacterium oryzihabitans]
MPTSLAARIRAFVIETFLFGDATTRLPEDGSFIEHGVIDSTGILELVAYVEDTFGITVADDEILPSNFDSIAKVEAFVTRKKAASAAQAA